MSTHPLVLLTVGQVADKVINNHDFPKEVKKYLSKNFLEQVIENSNIERITEDVDHYHSDLCGERRVLLKYQHLLSDSDAALKLISKQIKFLEALEKTLDTGLI